MKIPENKKIAGMEFISKKLIDTRRLLGKDFRKFRKCYFKKYHECTDADFHEELSGLLMKMTEKRGSKTAIAAPRDSAKSTIVSLEYVIYCICYKLESYIVIISNSKDQAIGFLRDVKHELESNERLFQDFPEVCDRQIKPKPSPWKEGEILTPNNVKVTALGTDQEMRGRRNKKDRPTLIILDDIETSEPIQNPENINRLEDWLTKSVLKAGTNITNIVYIGTIHHYDSLLAKFTGDTEYPGWEKRIYRSIISEPERIDFWDQWRRIFNRKELYEGKDGKEAAIQLFNANKKAMLKGTKVLWPARKSYHDLMLQREEEGSFSFDAEMQNDPVNRRDCLFSPEETHFWDDMYGTEEKLLEFLSSPGNMIEFIGACDPSMGKEGIRGDRSGIITLVKVFGDNKMYVLDADIAKRLPDKMYQDILMYHRRRNYSAFAFEINQAQEAMAMELQKRAIEGGLPLNIYEVRSSQHKITRIQTLQPMIKCGDILFSRKHYTLLEEMRHFPKGRFDDGLDALHMAVQACMNAPSRFGDYPQSSPVYTRKSDVLRGVPDLRSQCVPHVYNDRDRKDRFVPEPDEW
jgi:predicted phage terminase large subunit-like protein